MRKIDDVSTSGDTVSGQAESGYGRALAPIRALARRLLGQASTIQPTEESPASTKTLMEYLDEPGHGPGKGFGSHSVCFKQGPVEIDGESVYELPLAVWRVSADKVATYPDGRKVRLDELMVHEVVIATRGIGAER